MLIVGFLSWWYGTGWLQRFAMLGQRLAGTLDFFSPGLLLQTWFAPFRQISAGHVEGSLGVLWRAFVDQLISRIIGSIVRSALLIGGGVMLLVQVLLGIVELTVWLLLPLLPLAGVVLMLSGWTPTWM